MLEDTEIPPPVVTKYESKLGTNHELNRVLSYLLNSAHWPCPLLLVNIFHNDEGFRDFSIDVRHRFTLKKQFAQPQSLRQNCRRSFGIRTKILLIQGMSHGGAWLHGATRTFVTKAGGTAPQIAPPVS